ncbi:Fructose-1,6-bisphosphatase class 1 [Desulfovibrio sp. X2]|uniref:class 1 fructose-bisphosphatase n=1 Tax=Desulfovibrio sp. X2 TaxID=941449 RepID=UPI000358E682|nr:class 1 fructose-bisphosphatase [Desulfovibrio sp. X2]EPR42226.1 Fructose-1,6-bisphosphatase class 1 [Desulfovibrio sp. X2]
MPEVNVTEHLLLNQKKSPMARGQFTHLLNQLILSFKIISREVTKAGLVDVLGFTGEINVQGEEVKKLDEYSNNVLIHRMSRAGVICAMSSEENEGIIEIPAGFPTGDYVLIFDPLDGSSNIEANINIGTIFSVYRRKTPSEQPATLEDLLQQGVNQVAAGYCLYGSSTMMVMTTGSGVHGFTLDPSVGEFLLSHPDIKIPERGSIYSINEGYTRYWDAATREVVDYFKEIDNERKSPYSSRYIGSLVADFHRTLLYGGVFLYPADMRDPKKPKGKLRLMSEANPLSFVAEQAWGLATDGVHRILDIQPTALHQRVPLIIGSPLEVEKVREIYRKHGY